MIRDQSDPRRSELLRRHTLVLVAPSGDDADRSSGVQPGRYPDGPYTVSERDVPEQEQDGKIVANAAASVFGMGDDAEDANSLAERVAAMT